jgi:hypothetical protein
LQISKTDNALDIDAIYNLKLGKTSPNSTDSFTTKLNAKFPWPPIMPKQHECLLNLCYSINLLQFFILKVSFKIIFLFTPQSFVCPRMRLYTNANTRSSIKESEPLNNYVYFNKMVQFAGWSGWWVNVQCCFYHFWSYQMRRRPNSPFGRGVFCDGLLAVTSRRP